MQSEVMDKILQTDKSIVVSAPTSSGKTVILELAIVRLLTNMDETEYKGEFKIIYIAPIKALCNEITSDWKSKFDRLGVLCGSVTGDDADFDLNTCKFSIIVTTPEKFDSLSRKWNCCDYMSAIKLLMIDEVHLLNEDKRGPILEAVVSRMKTIRLKFNQQNDSADRIRFVAVSATIPNIADLASWLDSKDNTIYHKVSEDLRPVKLERHVLGYPYHNSTPFRFDMNLTYKLPSVIEKYAKNKPALIFCNSRRSAEMGATTIIDKVRLNLSDEQRQKIMVLSSQIEDVKLRKTISSGVAFHHAGLCVNDKKLIEEYFRSASLPILFSTNTLAMGVNLPAYLSIIKSTEMLISGAVHELSEAAVLQMIGRAGRPQFDDHGVAVIMTQNDKVKKYESLVTGTAPIESHLHNHLIEHLNSEIVSTTISNMDLVTHWIRSSYLYIRAIQKPFHYGFPTNATIETVEQKLEELCVNAIDELEKYGLVTKTDSSLKSTQLGRLMAHYYLNFETMKHFTKITCTESLQEMFDILITCPDFSSGYHLRVNDKRFLNTLSKTSPDNDQIIRYPVQGKVKTVTDKISCLMQAILGNIPITDSSVTEEASQLIKLGQRMGRALQEYIATLNVNNFSALVSIMLLLKSLHANLWENSPYVFKQFNKIGHVYSKILSSNGKTSFESIINSKPSDIEMILKKRPPFGKEFLDGALILPKFTLNMTRADNQISVVVKQVNPKFVCDPTSRGITLIVGDSTNETLFINHNVQYFLVKYKTFERTVTLKNMSASTVTAHLIHNGIVGLDKSETIMLHDDVHSEPIIQPEPIQMTAPKRKSQDKTVRRTKQMKISEYLDQPKKKAQKRKSNANTNAKKLKNSEAECDRQMAIMENDGILDLTEETSSPNLLDNPENVEEIEDNQATTKNAIDFVQRFKMPTKSVFKFLQPTNKSKDLSNAILHDNNANVEVTVEKTIDRDAALTSTNVITQKCPTVLPKNQLRATENAQTKPQPKVFGSSHETISKEISRNIQTESKGEEDQSETSTETKIKDDHQKLQNVYVPSCVKAVFGSQTVTQKAADLAHKKVHTKKDINFRYDDLLTPVDEVDLTSNSQNYSLCNVIEGQHKLHRTQNNRKTTVFPFRNLYINNLSAAVALQRIDQISQASNEVNDTEDTLFSLEYESFPAQRPTKPFSFEPFPMKEHQNKITRKEKTVDKPLVPMALNEYKYSKRNNFYKKLPTPQSSVPAQSSILLKPSTFSGIQKATQKDMTAQEFYNHLQEVPMMSAGNIDRSTMNPLTNNWNTSDDWFESSRRSQQATFSQMGYGSSSLQGFIPSQSEFHW